MSTQGQTLLKTGCLLMAEPFMLDPHFRRTVVLICDHQSEGSVGFILNRPVGMTINSLIADFPEFGVEVFYGGPVQTDTIHYIHTKGDLIPGSMEVIPGVYWGGDYEQLKFCIESQLIQPDEIRFFVGYSGWGQGQLQEEMGILSWMITPADTNYIFNLDFENLWKEVLEHSGDSYGVIAQMPLPNWN